MKGKDNVNSTGTTQAANPLDGITAAIESAIQQAREQADVIINDAREEAERIINDARAEAEQIIEDAGAQANTRARDDMERASLAIQEHAAALHTLALGLTQDTRDNTGADGGAGDDVDNNTSAHASSVETANADQENTSDTDGDEDGAASTNDANTRADSNENVSATNNNTVEHTTRRPDGTTRKLAPWETPQPEPDMIEDATANTPSEADTPHAVGTSIPQPETPTGAPQWDAPLIIDAPLQF